MFVLMCIRSQCATAYRFFCDFYDLFFFFFKQKTAYEMRISDWSSDVCSSDLQPVLRRLAVLAHHDDRRLDRREHRQHQVEEDGGIGVEGQPQMLERLRIDEHPGEQQERKADDEAPRTADRGNLVRQARAEAGPRRHPATPRGATADAEGRERG